MEQVTALLAKKNRDELQRVVRIARAQRFEGEHGNWEDFLKFYDPKKGQVFMCLKWRDSKCFRSFIETFNKEDHLKSLAFLLRPTRCIVHKFSREYPDEIAEQRLVRMTLTHEEHHRDYFGPYDPEDWFTTGISGADRTISEMISLCCECEDGNDSVIRVAAVDRHLKVILDEFVKPNQPDTTLSLSDIHDKLRVLLSVNTILVGHSLYKNLKALKMDHARVIDTSVIFKYDSSGSHERPSLNYLSKTILGQKVPHICVRNAEVAMKLVLSVVENGVDTCIPLPKDMLNDVTSGKRKRKHCGNGEGLVREDRDHAKL